MYRLVLVIALLLGGPSAFAESLRALKERAGEERTLKEKADAGDPEAQYQRGKSIIDSYVGGRGYQDEGRVFTEAFGWYKKAAEQGHVEAQFHLGLMYKFGEYGRNVRPDEAKAIEWFRKAASQGHANAQSYLDTMLADELYADTWGLGASKEKAAAAAGSAEAQYELAKSIVNRYIDGKGPQDEGRVFTEAFGWYRKAAEQGHVEAQFNLGKMYKFGEYGGNALPDRKKAIKWFEKAASQGHTSAQSYLDSMLASDVREKSKAQH